MTEERRAEIEADLRKRFAYLDLSIRVAIEGKTLMVRWCSGLQTLNGRYTSDAYATSLDAPLDEIVCDLRDEFRLQEVEV
jgi:hypothetical protein